MSEKVKPVILHVDDNEITRYTVRQMLQAEFDIENASCGAETFEKAQQQPDMIILDVHLPDMTGFEICKTLKADAETAHIPVLHLSATFMDAESRAQGLEGGADAYLTQPVEPLVLSATIRALLRIRQSEKTLKKSRDMLEKTLKSAISVISETIETKGGYPLGHHERVGAFVASIADEMDITDFQRQGLDLAAAVYDVGMVRIPSEILADSGKSHDISRDLYETYPQMGRDILKNIEFPWPLAEIVLQHREHYDGSGFPNSLSGNEILVEARILGVAHALEDLTISNLVHQAIPFDEALEVIAQNKGTLYDPDVVDACLRAYARKEQ